MVHAGKSGVLTARSGLPGESRGEVIVASGGWIHTQAAREAANRRCSGVGASLRVIARHGALCQGCAAGGPTGGIGAGQGGEVSQPRWLDHYFSCNTNNFCHSSQFEKEMYLK